MLNQMRSWCYLFRFADCLGACFSTWVGAYIAGVDFQSTLGLGMIAALAVAGNNVFNDVVDLETDRIDKPHRPIVAGQISPEIALAAGFACAVMAAMMSLLFLGVALFVWVSAVTALGFLYSLALKRVAFLGNAVVACSAGFTFTIGGLVSGNINITAIPALTIALVLLNREVMKTIEDIRGDSATGLSTAATLLGTKRALGFAFVIAIAAMLVSLVPVLGNTNRLIYLLFLIVGVDLPLSHGLAMLVRKGVTVTTLDSYMKWTKALFVTGPIAFLFLK